MSARDMSTPNGVSNFGASSSSTKTELGRKRTTKDADEDSTTTSNLSDWIEQRQKSFWDFEQSFLQPFDRRIPASTFQPPPPLRPIFSRPFFDSDENSQFLRPRAMLAAREDPNEEMSPKAKVTYDEDKFQVKNFFFYFSFFELTEIFLFNGVIQKLV